MFILNSCCDSNSFQTFFQIFKVGRDFRWSRPKVFSKTLAVFQTFETVVSTEMPALPRVADCAKTQRRTSSRNLHRRKYGVVLREAHVKHAQYFGQGVERLDAIALQDLVDGQGGHSEIIPSPDSPQHPSVNNSP
jgi:hypothetical protein